MSIFQFNYDARFTDAVASGLKRQTLRRARKDGRVPHPGDTLRHLAGSRTKPKLLLQSIATGSLPVRVRFHATVIEQSEFRLGARLVEGKNLEKFAQADGFETPAEMLTFLWMQYGPEPFEGWVVYW